MIKLDTRLCTGCGACAQVCPEKCIEMSPDRDGFVYPRVFSEKCVSCGKCERVCPIEAKKAAPYKPVALAAVNRDEGELLSCTSGGVFGELAKYVLGKKGAVYGCAFCEKLKARHIRITRLEEIGALKGSKYVQSDTADTYNEVKADLNNGLTVLYSGTPCQIDGLKRFLGKPYEGLITIDLICHGVPSQAYFDKFISGLEKRERSRITELSFRSKKERGGFLAGTYGGTYTESGKHFEKPFYYFEHYYYYYFLTCASYRESCYSCKYADLSRTGDFTLGDLWGAEGFGLNFAVDKGCSLVLLNSERAKEIFAELNLDSREIPLNDAVKYNAQLREPSVRPALRDETLKQYETMSADEIQQIFKRKNRKRLLAARIKYCVPMPVKNVIQKIRYKN